jgi:Ca-activated chloride channel family protein
MKRNKISKLALVAGLLVLAPHLRAQETRRGPLSVARAAVLRADVNMVLVPVTVTDHRGASVNGLEQKSFTLLEDKVPQKIVSFSREDSPSSVGVVLDVSGSMRNTLGTAKDVVQAFLRTTNVEDEFLLLTVSTQPAVIPAFTTDIGDLEHSVGTARPGGMTALIDTVYLGLNRMKEARQPRRALLILSDGIDNQSRYSQSELLRVALEADVQIYTIIFDTGAAGGSSGAVPFRPSMVAKPGDRGPQQQGPEMLEKLSERTGGLHFHVHNHAEANEAVTNAGQALRNEYLIGYQPADSATSGKWHRIQVKLDRAQVQVHTRTGYYAR